MPPVYLTPASISFLTQMILSGAIFVYLLLAFHRRKIWTRQMRLLSVFFLTITTFITFLFFETALVAENRLYFLYLENVTLAVALMLLLQFAYHFPIPYAKYKVERLAALGVSLIYVLYELLIAVFRLGELIGRQQVHYRPSEPEYLMGVLLVWVSVAFFRQSLAADSRPQFWLLRLWRSQTLPARGALEFALIYLMLLMLAVISLLRTTYIVPEEAYNIILSVGILVLLWLFASRYVGFIPGGTSILAKISAIALTLLLVTLGVLGWVISPAYARTYRPTISERQTLRFTPNASGGYEIAVIDFHFEQNLGQRTGANPFSVPLTHTINFNFPFYNKPYTQLHAASFGTIILGDGNEMPIASPDLGFPGVAWNQDDFRAIFLHRNMQACCFHVPAIFVLIMDFDVGPESALYVLQETGRVVITWYKMPAFHTQSEIYTFQIILYYDGVFDLNYIELPDTFSFYADGQLAASPILRGITPGLGQPQSMNNVDDLAKAVSSGVGGVTQPMYLDFRAYMHQFLIAPAWLVVISSFSLLLFLPWMLYSFIIRPLGTLLEGVRQMEAGNLDMTLDARVQDEIGILNRAFNHMTANLRETINSLERQVAVRTAELSTANERLQAELIVREETQAQLLEQQRSLSKHEERQRLGRDLHDSVNQSIHSLVLFSETLAAALEKGNSDRAAQIAVRLQESARQALKEMRLLLYKLRPLDAETKINLLEMLEARLDNVERRAGMNVQICLDGSIENCPHDWLENLYGIVLEALNNSLKHAQARSLQINISCHPHIVKMEISDDGRGFDQFQMRSGSMGLRTMRERASLLGGQLSITSNPGVGTTICFVAERQPDRG